MTIWPSPLSVIAGRYRIEGHEGSTVAALPSPLQRGKGERPPRRALDDQLATRCQQVRGVLFEERPKPVGESIGGVAEDEVKRALLGGEPCRNVAPDEAHPFVEAEHPDVPQRRADVAVDQGRH